MQNQPVAEIEAIRQACPQGLIDYMSGLKKAGILETTFQRTLANLATNAEGLKAVMNSAEFQSEQATLAVDAVSRALSELPAEKLNLLSLTMATAAKSLLARRSDKDASVGGQSTIPVSFTVDVQRRVVRSEQITFDLQRTITNSALQPSVAEEVQELASNLSRNLYTILQSKGQSLIAYLIAWATILNTRGRIDECNIIMILVFVVICSQNPQDK